ncbi:MAG: hypothetical protein BMS9Abin37_1430 [Acidobacteriota bacterium]|nr:MAG: hypothetical protein BMS9Abin37_1430 [Acidobacteriota bacterium]
MDFFREDPTGACGTLERGGKRRCSQAHMGFVNCDIAAPERQSYAGVGARLDQTSTERTSEEVTMDTHPRFVPDDSGCVTDVPCPLCHGFDFQFLLRCDLGLDACLPVIRCQRCGHTIVLDGRTGKRLREASLHESAGRCPYCASESTRLVMACDLRQRSAFATGRCRDCKQSFAM